MRRRRRSGVSALFVSDGDSFAPRRERFFCLRRPHFFQQRKKWGKERRQKLRFCTSSARYTCLLPSSFFLTRPAFSYPLSVSRLCQHSFPLPLPLAVAEISPLPNYSPQIYHTPCPTGTPTFAALRRQRRDLIIAKTVQRTRSYSRTASAAAAQAVQAIPRTDNVPRRANSARSAPPNLHSP